MRNNHENQIRLASSATMLFGVWLATSPLFLSISGGAFWNQLIAGVALVLFGGIQMFVKSTLPSLATGLIGAWMILAPFVLTVSAALVWSQVISGAAILLLAIWDGREVSVAEEYKHAM
jgi:hypothetical protein